MDMINQDRQVDPNSPYQLTNDMIESVNTVTESGKPLRRNSSMTAEEQRAADKKAYMEMMRKRKGK